MKNLFYVLLGAGAALLVKSVLDRRAQDRLEGAPPRPLPSDFDGEFFADETAGPLSEV